MKSAFGGNSQKGLSTVVIVLIVMAVLFFIALIIGVGIWALWHYKIAPEINGSSNKIPAANNNTTSPTADWKTFTSTKYGFSIKYPSTWIYKEYAVGDLSVAFAATAADLPKEQTDEPMGIGFTAIPAEDLDAVTPTDKILVEPVTIDGASANKITFLPGRPEEMYSDATIIDYRIPVTGATLQIENFDDYQKAIFEQMIQSFKFIK